ncbi:glutamine-hydrolyzing GMP synthase, partial [Pseudomonas sp. UBA6276]
MALDIHAHRILILDFGSQYTQLIARRVREIGVYCELHPFDMDDEAIRQFAPRGVILAGGPESVHEANSPRCPQAVFDLGVPVFGICYGMQTMAEQLGGKVAGSDMREFGYARVDVVGKSRILEGIEDHIDADGVFGLDVWMSHGDKVTEIPQGFHVLASTPSCPIAGMFDDDRNYYGVQFHPEVTHTKQGERILSRFIIDICGCEALWTPSKIAEDAIAQVRAQVGTDNVLLGLSGGVDSSVVAALLHKAIGDQLTCVFVDNGLLRLH